MPPGQAANTGMPPAVIQEGLAGFKDPFHLPLGPVCKPYSPTGIPDADQQETQFRCQGFRRFVRQRHLEQGYFSVGWPGKAIPSMGKDLGRTVRSEGWTAKDQFRIGQHAQTPDVVRPD